MTLDRDDPRAGRGALVQFATATGWSTAENVSVEGLIIASYLIASCTMGNLSGETETESDRNVRFGIQAQNNFK